MATIVLFAAIFMLVFVNFANSDSSKPCKLQWKNVLAGEELDETAVRVHGEDHFVAGYCIFGPFACVAGRMDRRTELAYINRDHTTYIETKYYTILTNPNDCAVSWNQADFGIIPPNELAFAIHYGSGYVGRGKLPEVKGEYFGGEIRDDNVFFAYNGLHFTMNAQFLRSSINLKSKMSDFVFASVPGRGTEDFLGFDLIINDSPSQVSHTIVHKKSVTETYSMTESKGYAETTTITVDINIPIPHYGGSIDFNFNKTNMDSRKDTSTVVHEEENEVVSTRTIHVPPYTAVQACSVVSMETDCEMPYWARGTFSVKGYTSSEVKKLLNEAGYSRDKILGVVGQSVIVNVTGALTVSIPMRTNFIVLPADDPNGCKELEAKINMRKRAKRFKNGLSMEMIKTLDDDIQRIIYGN